jgi:hypothetical protein
MGWQTAHLRVAIFQRMKQHIGRKALGVLLLASAACGDARVKKLEEGISRDSLLSILRDGGPQIGADSLPHIYEAARYLMNGREYEIFYYTKGDEVAGADSLPAKKLTPIVLVHDTLTGWGWQYWDSVAKSINLPVPSKR